MSVDVEKELTENPVPQTAEAEIEEAIERSYGKKLVAPLRDKDGRDESK